MKTFGGRNVVVGLKYFLIKNSGYATFINLYGAGLATIYSHELIIFWLNSNYYFFFWNQLGLVAGDVVEWAHFKI